jgi:hypothetical protein
MVNYDWEWNNWDWRIFLAAFALYVIAYLKIVYCMVATPKDTIENDTWNKCVIKTWWFEDTCISSWPIIHFLQYLFIGLVLPVKWYKYFIVLGVIWELAEYIGGKCVSQDKQAFDRNPDGERQYAQWLQGKYGDLVANMLGLSLGFVLKLSLDKGSTFIKTQQISDGDVSKPAIKTN